MIEKIRSWFIAIENYPSLLTDFNKITNELSKTKHEIDLIEAKLTKLKTQIKKEGVKTKWEKHWINKHPKKNISYLRHELDGDYYIDVRAFVMKDYNYPVLDGLDHDETAWNCLVWIMEDIIYTSDISEYKKDEYWAFPYQTIKRRKGDCDDGAILLWNIMLSNGVPYWRVRLNAGDVKDPSSGVSLGHAYVTYCRETDNQWVVLDWCYYPKYERPKDRPLHRDERDYYDIWWSTDSVSSYGNKKYMKSMPGEVFGVE